METVQQIFMVIGALTLICAAGAAFTFGVAMTCRWLAWSPINVNVTVNQHEN